MIRIGICDDEKIILEMLGKIISTCLEELGVEAEEKDLQYIATIKSTKNPKNMEFAYVYLLRCNKKIEEYTFEDDEVSEVKYVLYKDLEKMVEEKAEGLLIHKEEFEKLFQYIRSL